MNIQEYISSGILERYVLGAASEQESREVEKLSESHPEVKEEIVAIQDALIAYVSKQSIDPPAHLKNKLIATIETVEEINHRKEEVNVVSMKPVRANFDYKALLIAAAFLLLLVSGFYISRLAGDIRSLNTDMKRLRQHDDSLNTVMALQKEQQKEAEKLVAILKHPMTKIVKLKGMGKAPDAGAMVVWNAANKEVFVEIEKLPVPPGGMQYQLWALNNGQPVDAGMIGMTADSSGAMHKMKNIEQAQAFAITLEKKGGSPAPQGEMYAMGNI